jgi:hypothetical protein
MEVGRTAYRTSLQTLQLRNVTQGLLYLDEFCGKLPKNVTVRARNSLRIRWAGARECAKCIHTSELKTQDNTDIFISSETGCID